jgi:membrane-bound metal-dependent hydrolase YbcI (DUF457 family)
MPSPIGHALGGIAVGTLISRERGWLSLALLAGAGALADIDFLLPMRHRGPSHSLAGAVLVFGIVWGMTANLRAAAAVGAAYASHTVLDWLGADSSAPRGVMAFWPVSHAYFVSGLDLFNSVDRRYWMPGFLRANAIAVARELLILGPVAVLSTRRTRGRSSVRGDRPPPTV